jgi:hypothetical protein
MADVVAEAKRTIETFYEPRVPAHLKDEIRIECTRSGRSISILERRPPWKPEFGPEWTTLKVAQLRYDDASGTWSLYWSDRNGRWHPYDLVSPRQTVAPLLAEIESDPTGIFWG